MRKVAVTAGLALILAACASHNAPDVPPAAPPSPEYPVVPQQAVSDARFNEMQTSMTELLERLDVMNDRLAKLEAAQADLTSSTERRVAERVVEPVRVTPVPVPPAVAQPAAPVPALAAPAPVLSSRVTPPARADTYAQYRNALVLYGKNRWAEARNVFQQIFDAEPAGELADNALYWIGETYYAAGDYGSAMRYYGRVIREYPNENKAPDAMFKTGLAYVKQGDLGMARKAFEETIQKYPYATAAASAKAELSRIKY